MRIAVLSLLLALNVSADVLRDADIRKILIDRIDTRKQGVAIVVGVIEPSGRRVIAHGTNGDTLFELGSMTKLFTALLLADAVQRGEVKFDDPISKYLPESEHSITLRELATQDAGLLEQILARRAGVDYESLLRTRITAPLRMKSTTSKRSTANDLLNFLGATMRYTTTPLGPAMKSMLASPETALGWNITKTPSGRELVWHSGGTGGYRSFIGFDPNTRSGVVVLANMFTNEGIDDIGRQLLDPAK